MKLAVLVDGSEFSNEAFHEAILLLRDKAQDQLYIIHAAEKIKVSPPFHLKGDKTKHPDEPGSPEKLGTSTSIKESDLYDVNEKIKNHSEGLVYSYARTATAAGVQNVVEKVIVSENAKEATVEFLNQEKFDYVLVGSRGLGAVKRLLIGSFSDYIMRSCHCSVLVIRKH